MKTFLPILLLVAALGSLRADPPAAAGPASQGIIILKAGVGHEASNSWFVSIQWTDHSSGVVIDKAGNKLPFFNEEIGHIFYFDRNYYEEVNHNPYWLDWRAGLQSREVVLPPIPSTVLDAGDTKRLADEQAVLQDAIDHYPTSADVLQPLIDTLKDESSKLAQGLVFQNGAWIAAKDAGAAPSIVPVIGESSNLVTFTTKDGKRFENAKVTATASGLSVLTADGGASVSFDRLPDDLTPFPKAVQAKIADWRTRQVEAASTASAESSSNSEGWWGWMVSAWQWVASTVGSFFSATKPVSGPDGSS